MSDREYELKFTIDPDAVDRLLSHPALAGANRARRETRLVSTYFETSDEALRQRRISLRVRRDEAGSVQTLKRAGSSRVDRDEWERVGGGSQPDAAWLSGLPVGASCRKVLARPLRPRFTVDVRRSVFPIDYHGAILEGALDQGEIRAGNAGMPVSEFEIEWKSGSRAAVLALAHELARDLPLTLSLMSKAERGYALAEGSAGKPSAALALGQARRAEIAPAFGAVVQSCLHMLLANASLVASEDPAEAVHKTRIAARRLRGLFQLFKPVLRREALTPLMRDLKWLSHKLGAARDADVFQAATFDPAVAAGLPGAATLAGIMREHQEATRQALREALASHRGRKLPLAILALSEDGVRPQFREARYLPFVKKRLAKRRRSVLVHARHLSRLPSEAVHDLRKRAKTLRYNLDLMRTADQAFSRGGLRRLQAALGELQETLGALHDGEAMREHLRTVVFGQERAGAAGRASPSEAAFAAGMIAAQVSHPRKQIRQARKIVRSIRDISLLR